MIARTINSVTDLSHFIEAGPFRYAAQQIRAAFNKEGGERWFEWLLRPQVDSVTTGEFVSAVQSMKLAIDLDQRVIRDAVGWLDRQPITTRLTINVSSDSISNRFFPRFISSMLNHSTVLPEQICFDLLVSDAIGDLSSTGRFVREMRKLGCAIALDTGAPGNPVLSLFGPMGYIDYFKIDRQWVTQAPTSASHRTTLESIADYGQRLGIELVAVGVDGPEHLALIRELGIEYYQGYINGLPQIVRGWGFTPPSQSERSA